MITQLKVVSSRRYFRKFWLNIHLYLAFSVGFFFALLGVTGSLNVFFLELDVLLNPAVHIEQGEKTYRPMDEIMASVRAEHPHRDGLWMMFMPRPGQPTLRAIYPKPEETADKYYGPLMVDVDPYTAEVISSRFWGDTLMTQIYELHTSLLLGVLSNADIGRLGFKIVGFLGLLLFISLGTGIYLWWPQRGKLRKALTIKRGASAARLNYDVHRSLGIYSSIVLLVLAFTGFSFPYRDWVQPVVVKLSPVNAPPFKNPPELKSIPLPGIKAITLDQAVAVADQVFPNAELRWIATPNGPDGYYAVEKRQQGELNIRRPRSKVWVDQYSGKILKMETPENFTAGDIFLNLMFILHNGEALGLPGRILVCLTGLILPTLYVTGLLHWLRKRRTRNGHLVLG
ncbi:PepSY-associated TM helix domain-containing protein [Methylobacter sp. Wu1]|uniref:PepSY-associated TM helix domain-containing protein n=1 Tax=Methylobacter sp. Wu1 TaxID=3119359 RepID=UPI002F925DE2